MSSKLFIPNDVLETIVCLNCSNYLSVFPIYTKCDSSGAICGRCKLVEDDKFIRDEAFEGIAQFLVFPCRHSTNGCKEQLTPPKLEKHERCCEFRKFDCPSKNYSKCQWKGPRGELIQHFEDKHSSLLLKEPHFELNFVSSQEEYLMLPHDNELFIVKKEVDARKGIFSCSVEHLKATEDSEVYNHFLKLASGNGNYSFKGHEKTTCDNEKLNSTQLTSDILRERLQDPASIVINIVIVKAKIVDSEKDAEGAGDETTKPDEKQKNPNINWDLLSDLACPICFEYILPPIYQCITGHSICEACKKKINNVCPTCRSQVQDTKNYALEKMIQYFMYPCKFHKSGCQYASIATTIRDHENGCEFGPYNCPLKDSEGCAWNESHAEVANHIDQVHVEFFLKNDKVDIPFNRSQSSEKIFLIKYQKKIFKLLYKFDTEKFYWCMQFIGPANESKRYRFEIDVIDLSQSKRRWYFTGLVIPLTEQSQCFTKSGNYVSASLDQLEAFTNNNFSFRVRVVKESA